MSTCQIETVAFGHETERSWVEVRCGGTVGVPVVCGCPCICGCVGCDSNTAYPSDTNFATLRQQGG